MELNNTYSRRVCFCGASGKTYIINTIAGQALITLCEAHGPSDAEQENGK
jgi:hypothetical protein